MTDVIETVQRRLPASGPLVLRTIEGAAPRGFRSWGPRWAALCPDTLVPADLVETSLGFAIGAAGKLDQTRKVLDHFLNEQLSELVPIPRGATPVSSHGLGLGAALLDPVPNERTRAERLKAHRAALGQLEARAPTHAPFPDLLLRQVSVLQLAAAATVALQRHGDGSWLLEFREAGRLGHLLDRPEWLAPVAKDKAERLQVQPSGSLPAREAGRLVALARAVQLAELALGSGLDPHARLRVEVWNADLWKQKLALTILPEDRGLPFARLARHIRQAVADPQQDQLLDLLPCRPRLLDDVAETAFSDHRPIVVADALRWHGAEADPLRRLTYAGDRATSSRFPLGLPFALTGRHGARQLALMAPDATTGYAAWLAGPRRADGCRPDYLRPYVMGLEFRLLSDAVPAKEATLLLKEIWSLRDLAQEDAQLRAQIDALLDWHGATRRQSRRALSNVGPLTVLTRLGRAVMVGTPLTSADLAALDRVLGSTPWATQQDGLRPELPAQEDLLLPPPRAPLAASYRSISGLSDADRTVIRHQDRPVPDLRQSVLLRAVLDARRPAGERRPT